MDGKSGWKTQENLSKWVLVILARESGRGVQLSQEPGFTDPLDYMTNIHSALDARGW